MKYPYIVVKNGVWYSSGSNVPEDTDPVLDKKVLKYKKSDINKMPIAELRKLAIQNNIPDATIMVGTDLKKKLIEKLGL